MSERTSIQERHLSFLIMKGVVTYVQKRHPQVDTRKIAKEFNVDLDQLFQKKGWISVATGCGLIDRLIHETKDENLLLRAGENAFSVDTLGSVLYGLVRFAFHPLLTFKLFIDSVNRANNTTVFRIHTDLKRREFVFEMRPKQSARQLGVDVETYRKGLNYSILSVQGHIKGLLRLFGIAYSPTPINMVTGYDNDIVKLYFSVSSVLTVATFQSVALLALIALPIASAWIFADNGLAITGWKGGVVFGSLLSVGVAVALLWDKGRRLHKAQADAIDQSNQSYEDAIREKKMQETLKSEYAKYVRPQILTLLGKNSILDVKKGDRKVIPGGVAFIDIRDYTSISEILGPEQLFDTILKYTETITPAIHQNSGFVGTYIGDGILALFPKDSSSAFNAAIQMLKSLDHANRHTLISDSFIRMGIGLSYGEFAFGIIGNEEQLKDSSHGDCVNVAARIQGLSKIFGRLLVSKEIFKRLPTADRERCRSLGLIYLNGKLTPVEIFVAREGTDFLKRDLYLANGASYSQAIQSIRKRDLESAERILEGVISTDPEDPAAKFLLRSIRDPKLRNDLISTFDEPTKGSALAA